MKGVESAMKLFGILDKATGRGISPTWRSTSAGEARAERGQEGRQVRETDEPQAIERHEAGIKQGQGPGRAGRRWIPAPAVAITALSVIGLALAPTAGAAAQAQDGPQEAKTWSAARTAATSAINPSNAGLTPSLQFARNMGRGWNLGNSFDAVDTNWSSPDRGEQAWGNPEVTPDLLKAVKAKGYTSIRIPMTVYRRYRDLGSTNKDGYRFLIDQAWLNRYRQVVDQAKGLGMHVLVNIHHDSWIWLKQWNGQTGAKEEVMFSDFWKQLARTFADEPDRVAFETINEPQFNTWDYPSGQEKLDRLNTEARTIIRSVPGNEHRMIVMPTPSTTPSDEYTRHLASLIKGFKDPYVAATVHYYSEWLYSANLGITGFDERIGTDNQGRPTTARTSAAATFKTIQENLTSQGIGTVIGEYGLLGYDTGSDVLQEGEEVKYYEYMNQLARQGGVGLMLWDNGSMISRQAPYGWKNARIGSQLQAAMNASSSYATGADTIYLDSKAQSGLAIPLTLNGNTFVGITGLSSGSDYVYDPSSQTVNLTPAYLNRIQSAPDAPRYGQLADLTLRFSAGADWHEYVVRNGQASSSSAWGKRSGITIPMDFAGNAVRRVSARQGGRSVGPNSSWWSYLQAGSAFSCDRSAGTFTLTGNFFGDPTVSDGTVDVTVDFFNGPSIVIPLTLSSGSVQAAVSYPTGW